MSCCLDGRRRRRLGPRRAIVEIADTGVRAAAREAIFLAGVVLVGRFALGAPVRTGI